MAGQTAEDIRDNIVKIADENGNCVGTGFFIHKEYCVTCHHNIYRLDEIYVERENNTERGHKKRFHAEWVEEFSDMEKDVAFLKIKDADFKPLEYRKETYGNIPVGVRGFPLQNIYEFPQGRDERGTLTDILEQFRWKEDEAIEEFEDTKKKWNTKPEVNVDVYAFSGKFYGGFSGAPVCYQHDWKVVGMFEAKDDNQGFIIPMNIVVDKFDLEKETRVSAPSPTLNTREILDNGNKYYFKHEYAKAMQQYKFILNDSNYVHAWNNTGNALHQLGKHEKAIACYDKALEINPKYADAWIGKGSSLGNLGKHEKAIACYDKALEINPKYALAWRNKGTTLSDLGKHEKAIACYDKALKINPKYADALNNKGKSLISLGRYEEAIKHLDKAVDIDPNHAYALNNKGLALLYLGRYEEAIKHLDKALEINPKYADALNNKGLALLILGNHKEAIKYYDKTLKINPKHVRAWYGKGLSLGKLGIYEDSIECFDKALKINPKYADAWYSRALSKVRKGRIENGLADLKKAVEIDEKFKSLAKQEKDFESIRDTKRFKAIVTE